MLIATSDRVFETSRVGSTLVLERRFRVHVLHRDRLLFDSRYSPSPKRGATGTTLYIVIEGSFQIAGGPVMTAPVAFVLAEHEFERVTPASTTFRSWGSPSVTIELRLRDEDVRASIGLAAGPLALSEATWARCRELATASVGSESSAQLVRPWLAGLAEDRVIASEVAPSVVDEEPEPFIRLWAALRVFYARHATSASIREIKRATGLSLRQLARDLTQLTRAFGLGGGFRDASHVLRLRAAIVLLSAPGATSTEIARQVGYKSLDAMGRAFRDARLPPPSAIQEQITYRDQA